MLKNFIYGCIEGAGLVLFGILISKLYKKIDSKKNGCLTFVVSAVALVLLILIALIIFAITSGN